MQNQHLSPVQNCQFIIFTGSYAGAIAGAPENVYQGPLTCYNGESCDIEACDPEREYKKTECNSVYLLSDACLKIYDHDSKKTIKRCAYTEEYLEEKMKEGLIKNEDINTGRLDKDKFVQLKDECTTTETSKLVGMKVHNSTFTTCKCSTSLCNTGIRKTTSIILASPLILAFVFFHP